MIESDCRNAWAYQLTMNIHDRNVRIYAVLAAAKGFGEIGQTGSTVFLAAISARSCVGVVSHITLME